MDTTFFIHLANGLAIGSSYVLIALGFTLIFGILDIIQLAHGEIYMLGAYCTYFLLELTGMSFFPALVVSAFVLAAVGLLLERILFRPLKTVPLLNLLLITIGLSIFLMNLANLLWTPEQRTIPTPYMNQTLHFLGLAITVQRVLVVVVTIIVMIAVVLFIRRSRIGKAMRAVAQDKEGAAVAGININLVRYVTLAVGCGLASVAGSLVGPIYLVEPTMGATPVYKAFVIVILGGMGSVGGSIVGGLLLGVIETLSAAYISLALKDTIAFIMMVLILWVRPAGLFGKILE
jgi:branched-chain amino acid transport system permease protein